VGHAGELGVAGEHGPYASGAVGLLPAGREEVGRASVSHGVHVQTEGFLERGGERDEAVLVALALGDADATGVEVDGDQLSDADAV